MTIDDRMTLLERLLSWWKRPTPVATRTPALFPLERSTPAVPAGWLSLYTYLEHRYASTVVLTFAQMETLLGRALPAAARTERSFWTDGASRRGGCSDAWTAARRTATPNLLARTVAFERWP
jgi:hypothetical protein